LSNHFSIFSSPRNGYGRALMILGKLAPKAEIRGKGMAAVRLLSRQHSGTSLLILDTKAAIQGRDTSTLVSPPNGSAL
jgi:hypothetical protein